VSSGVRAVQDCEDKLIITSLKLLCSGPLRSKLFTQPCSTPESSFDQYMAANPNQSGDCGPNQNVRTKRPVALKMEHYVRDYAGPREILAAKQAMSVYAMAMAGAMAPNWLMRAGPYLPISSRRERLDP